MQTRLYNRAVPSPPAHYHPLVRSVARALRERCDIQPGSTLVVGCSGGADSVALLRGLAMLAPRRKWRLRLIVGHVQHHLRDEAEADAQFVEQLAASLALPFARRDIEPSKMQGNLEANARDLRYQALAQIADEHTAPLLATAHHADDQLETLLMRILRGSSVAGLRGIAWHKTLAHGQSDALRVIRPMLGIDQCAIHDFLKQLDQPWREDATNADTSRTRAKLRHEVLPLLKSLQADAPAKANALTDHLRDVHALVQDAADRVDQGSTQKEAGIVLSREQARKLNPAVLTEVFRRVLLDAGCAADQLSRHAMLPAVVAAQDDAGGDRRFAFSNGIKLSITRQAIALVVSPRPD